MRGIIDYLSALRRRRITVILLLGLICTVGLLTLPAADLTGPRADDRHITTAVVSLLEREHLSKHKLDDEISQRGFEAFLKSLDPLKLYFLQSDIDEFKRYQNLIDNRLKEKDIRFAYQVFERFLERVDQRVAAIDQILQMEHDFTLDEQMVIDRDIAQYAKNSQEAFDRWRKRIKYDLLIQKGDEKEGKEAIEKLKKRYSSFAKRMHQFDGDELLEMYLTSVTSSFDPHTTFMSKSTLENFRIALSLKLEGIGAALMSADGQTKITKIIPGGAAHKHGKLKIEDQIVSVGQGEDGEMVDVQDMKLNDVVHLIRGDAGTVVRLGVQSAGENEVKTYKITRAKIELKDSEARSVIFEEGKKPDGKPFKLGVIDLPSFYMDMEGAKRDVANFKSTTRDMRKILQGFNEKEVDVVVLDLRHNGGGSLTEAIHCTGLFIDRGPVVQVKDQDDRRQVYDDRQAGMEWDGPLVVVTSKFSASASEILAGAIQDYGRGIIVGDESTHGKGTVQSLLDLGQHILRVPGLKNMGALKITMQQFYRPNGDSTQKRGVLSDVVLPSISNHMDIGEADLDFAVDFHRIEAATYKKVGWVNQQIVQNLSANSASRREKSEDFQKLLKNIQRYRDQKNRKKVSLNEEKFFARRAEIDAQKEDEKQLDEQANPDEEVVKRDFYFNEVLAITVDYLQQLEMHRIAKN